MHRWVPVVGDHATWGITKEPTGAPTNNLKPGRCVWCPFPIGRASSLSKKFFVKVSEKYYPGKLMMSTQRESKLSRVIQTELRKYGAWCIKIHGSEFMPAGIPDILICYKGRFMAFETKLPEKRSNTSVMQERVMEKIRAAGGHAQVVCTVQEAINAMIKHA